MSSMIIFMFNCENSSDIANILFVNNITTLVVNCTEQFPLNVLFNYYMHFQI